MLRFVKRRGSHDRLALNFFWKSAREKFADQSAVGNGGFGAHGVTDAETVDQTGEINTAGTKVCVDDRRGGQRRAFKRFNRAVPARRVLR